MPKNFMGLSSVNQQYHHQQSGTASTHCHNCKGGGVGVVGGGSDDIFAPIKSKMKVLKKIKKKIGLGKNITNYPQ